jgi:hypothetical protein
MINFVSKKELKSGELQQIKEHKRAGLIVLILGAVSRHKQTAIILQN